MMPTCKRAGMHACRHDGVDSEEQTHGEGWLTVRPSLQKQVAEEFLAEERGAENGGRAEFCADFNCLQFLAKGDIFLLRGDGNPSSKKLRIRMRQCMFGTGSREFRSMGEGAGDTRGRVRKR